MKQPKFSLDIHKSPSCGCCGDWVDHMEDAGFVTKVHDADNLAAQKKQLGVDPHYQSCHTAVSEDGRYFFEGHVPAKLVERFLKERPKGAIGLAVPGMPVGSPGMEMEKRFDPYEVMQINRDGTAEVYAKIKSAADQY